jgi:predicted nucleic acid-binding protein
MMGGYLLDTNQVSDAIKAVSPVRDRIRQVSQSGARIGTCIPVLFELEAGLQGLADPARRRQALRRLLDTVRVWPLEAEMIRHYGEVFLELRQLGRVLSQVDMMLVAMARAKRLTLLTADRDFEPVPGLRTENWLADPGN